MTTTIRSAQKTPMLFASVIALVAAAVAILAATAIMATLLVSNTDSRSDNAEIHISSRFVNPSAASYRIAEAVSAEFPEVQQFSLSERKDPHWPEYPNSMNIMIPNWDTEEGQWLGNDIAAFLYANQDELPVHTVTWRSNVYDRTGWSPRRSSSEYPIPDYHTHIQVYSPSYYAAANQ